MRNLKIFTENIEGQALNQIYNLLNQEPFAEAKVRIMPDVHAGAGCVVGFTADLGDKVIPNVVGVDIGCGMLTTELGNMEIDLQALDHFIKMNIPHGFAVNNRAAKMPFKLDELKMFAYITNPDRIEKSLGSLGGGNHFIEIATNKEGTKYLIIHTGSRNLGLQVAKFYQNIAIAKNKTDNKEERERVIKELKAQGKVRLIPDALKALTPTVHVPDELAFLEGVDRERYLHDMRMCQVFASHNRKEIARKITEYLGLSQPKQFETIHNYIGDDNIIRKGAISAYEGEVVLIPINMRDGSILGIGKGNSDWNNSAPHGAGRIMSRSAAKNALELEQFKEDMKDVFTTTATKSTIDESPRAYKELNEIVENIKDTVEVLEILKPIYNFKSAE